MSLFLTLSTEMYDQDVFLVAIHVIIMLPQKARIKRRRRKKMMNENAWMVISRTLTLNMILVKLKDKCRHPCTALLDGLNRMIL